MSVTETIPSLIARLRAELDREKNAHAGTAASHVALRAELAATQAREARLREAALGMLPHISRGEPYGAELRSSHRMAMRELELALAEKPS